MQSPTHSSLVCSNNCISCFSSKISIWTHNFFDLNVNKLSGKARIERATTYSDDWKVLTIPHHSTLIKKISKLWTSFFSCLDCRAESIKKLQFRRSTHKVYTSCSFFQQTKKTYSLGKIYIDAALNALKHSHIATGKIMWKQCFLAQGGHSHYHQTIKNPTKQNFSWLNNISCLIEGFDLTQQSIIKDNSNIAPYESQQIIKDREYSFDFNIFILH